VIIGTSDNETNVDDDSVNSIQQINPTSLDQSSSSHNSNDADRNHDDIEHRIQTIEKNFDGMTRLTNINTDVKYEDFLIHIDKSVEFLYPQTPACLLTVNKISIVIE
jgi:hypothetical protein